MMKTKEQQIQEDYQSYQRGTVGVDVYEAGAFKEGWEAGNRFASQSKWISVEERLPTSTDSYLCYDEDEDVVVVDFIISTDGGAFICEQNITHWQPLPSPPTK